MIIIAVNMITAMSVIILSDTGSGVMTIIIIIITFGAGHTFKINNTKEKTIIINIIITGGMC